MTTSSPDLDLFLEEDTQEAKPCELRKYNPLGEAQPCDNEAVYKVSLIKPCAHIADVLLCEDCWMRTVVLSATMTWICRNPKAPTTCGKPYLVAAAVVAVDRI